MKVLEDKVTEMMQIREHDIPVFSERVSFMSIRLTRSSRWLVRQKFDNLNRLKM